MTWLFLTKPSKILSSNKPENNSFHLPKKPDLFVISSAKFSTMRKKIIIVLVGSIVLLLGIVLFSNWTIDNFSEEKTFSAVEKIKKNRVGLILGTSKYLVGGGKNPFFIYRVEAAVKLYENGKIDFILVSGDNSHRYYNEPRDLTYALLKRGIPRDKIFLDFAGFSTLDSVIRAKKVFGLDSVTIISQKFHNLRAIYLARHNGLEAIGFNAKDPPHGIELNIREYLAKTKAYFDVLFNTQPKFLGKPIQIK